MKKTPLYPAYQAYTGRWTHFAGWLLPLEYTGILREHRAVREAAGLFDVSHMGRIEVTGTGALEFLNRLVTNNLDRAANVVYTPLCFACGGTADDLLVYRFTPEHLLLVSNAANRETVAALLREQAGDRRVKIRDLTTETAQLALQGPAAAAIIEKVAPAGTAEIKSFQAVHADLPAPGPACLISRTGYTGEDGFELYCAAGRAVELWRLLLEAGKEYGLLPAGLGARDLLRLEAGFPLYGQDLSGEISPLQACLERFIKWEKPVFLGKEALLAQKKTPGLPRRAGLVTAGRAVIPRAGCEVIYQGQACGRVTSGGFSPSLQKGIALALVTPVLPPGTGVKLRLRGRDGDAVTAAPPFYRAPRPGGQGEAPGRNKEAGR